MRFSAQRDVLNTAAQITQRAVAQRSPMPVLSCLLFETSGNTLTVTATDLQFGIRCTVPVNTMEEGAAALPYRHVSSLFSRLPEMEIDVRSDPSDNTIIFTYGESELVLNGYPAEEFPNFPVLPQHAVLKIKQSTFKDMLKKVLFAVASDEHRPVFTGVHMQVNEAGTLTLVATDTRKLAVCEAKLELPADRVINVIVPGKTLNELYKLIEAVEAEIEIYITENQVFFVINNICIMSRLIAGKFPDYKIVLPSRYVCEIKAAVNDLIEAAERVSLLVDPKRNVFNIHFQNNSLIFYFFTGTGRIREEITAELSGEPIDVGFNVRFFLELLRSMDSEEVIIQLSGRDSPAMFKPAGDDSYFSILVPAIA